MKLLPKPDGGRIRPLSEGGCLGGEFGGVDFSDLAITIKAAGDAASVTLDYGKFVQTAVDFLTIAFAIFVVIKAVNSLKKKQEKALSPPPGEEVLLTEIRDLLKQK